MKNFDSDEHLRDNGRSTDVLIDKRGQNCSGNEEVLIRNNNGFKFSMGQKGYGYENLPTYSNNHDSPSYSLPACVNTVNHENYYDNTIDNKSDKLIQDNTPNSISSESWFRTWPERYDKLKSCNSSPVHNQANPYDGIGNKNVKNKFTFNEALQNISLAYSPVTKQLHVVEKSEIVDIGLPVSEKDECRNEECKNEDSENTIVGKKLGHRRIEAGSFSSTVSTLSGISDPSTSGSLLGSDDQSLSSFDIPSSKPRKKSITNFFSKHVFSWKGSSNEPAHFSSNVWNIFNKQSIQSLPSSPVNVVASSSALIQNERPSNLPAKSVEEEQKHRDEYKAILAAAKKKDAQSSAARHKQRKLQLKLEEQLAAATKHFTQSVLPNWDAMRSNRKTIELWWQGLPSSVRGKVWKLAIGNDLNLTQQLYEICLSRAQNRLNSPEPPPCNPEIDQESSMDVIQLDISRTFPHLCIFQEGGPYSDTLHSLLAAYVCYRPDVGYVQGMSYIAAILILNMEPFDAFICFANLLNQPLHLSAFTLNQEQMQAYYSAYNQVFSYNLPKLYSHFERSGLTPDLYLLDWIYTIFAKAMPLDIACRVWDVFLRDGYEFIFRTALGILHLHQDDLMEMDFLHGAQFLTHLPDDISSDHLFKSIQLVSTTIGKRTFYQIVEKCFFSLPESMR
ncbi:TBC1 domain family member 12 [Leptinotarsa decemlineata]|uniref:TBC1 domain family member 12 n=1 Tax=Leptinotarsa decemlineata TaxID=7539 RepID=UPI000C25227A|nr:TBC1 domain family member 14-like [Leptinotarsa decemlineata]